jgi:hypothetical protein
MKQIQLLAALVLALGLLTSTSSYAALNDMDQNSDQPEVQVQQPGPGEPQDSGNYEIPGLEQPESPLRLQMESAFMVSEVPSSVRESLVKALEHRMQYLTARAEALKSMRGANAEARAEIRAKLKETREDFLALQRENRHELRRSLEEIRERLADHAEVVNQIKEEAKAKAKERRGPGDE